MEEIEVLLMKKIKIMKSLHKAQLLCLTFCSTMQDYKKKRSIIVQQSVSFMLNMYV